MTTMSNPMRPLLLSIALASSLFAATAVAGPQEDARAQNALRVLTDIQAIPEKAIMPSWLALHA